MADPRPSVAAGCCDRAGGSALITAARMSTVQSSRGRFPLLISLVFVFVALTSSLLIFNSYCRGLGQSLQRQKLPHGVRLVVRADFERSGSEERGKSGAEGGQGPEAESRVLAASLGPTTPQLPPLPESCGSHPWGRLQHLAESVIIFVLAGDRDSVHLVRDTWARCVPNVHFVGACDGCTVRTAAGGSWFTLPRKVMTMWRMAPSLFPSAKAFLKLDLDTFVFYENLLLSLEAFLRDSPDNSTWPDYMGCEMEVAEASVRDPSWIAAPEDEGPTRMQSVHYASGGGGYLLSRQAAEALSTCQRPEEATTSVEDGLVGLCMREARIALTHHPGFHPQPLDLEVRAWVDRSVAYNKVGDWSVSRRLVTLHNFKDPYAFLALQLLATALEKGNGGGEGERLLPSPWLDFVGPPALEVDGGGGRGRDGG
jgi:hypothetical protein